MLGQRTSKTPGKVKHSLKSRDVLSQESWLKISSSHHHGNGGRVSVGSRFERVQSIMVGQA